MSKTKRVLIVDDRRAVRQGLQALFALWPEVVCVGEAADGHEAVKLVAEQRPDAVLMDVWMQGMDGLEATRRIKSKWPDVQVIVLTMRAENEEQALAAGADAFLVKGGPSEVLRETIRKTSARTDEGAGAGVQGGGGRQAGDTAGSGSSVSSHRLRKNGRRPVDGMSGMIPWYGRVPSGRGRTWATPDCTSP